jgi:hypothetical protein
LALAAFLAARLTSWPPHEDEMLVLTVGRGSFSDLVDTVVHRRGGAPLHFVLAWVVEHAGGGLIGIRLLSAIFALASVPLIAAITRRLTNDDRAALVAAVLAVSSWVLLFHAIYARMYSLFLFTSALSYLALLNAERDGGARRWSLWVAATLLVVATHPYGALVLASQVLYMLLTRRRLGEAVRAFAAVAVLGVPFWIIDRTLAGRFDVGVGGGGATLGRPDRVLLYLGETAGDFSAGPIVLPAFLFLFAVGAWLAWRERRREALLVVAAVGTPAAAFLLARLGASAAPETRHLIFVLPFFLAFVAAGVVRRPARLAAGLTAVLAVGAVVWAWDKTPTLFTGEPAERVAARDAAATWISETGRPDDILLGYEPVFVAAQERDPRFSRLIVPRADSRLALRQLQEARRPLGRGVWVLNAWTTGDPQLSVEWRLPRPGSAFEARVFGPYLVVRTRAPTVTPKRYLRLAAAVMVAGKTLGIVDADVNFTTIVRASTRLEPGYEAASSRRSASTISR